jgi:hypothetical protein
MSGTFVRVSLIVLLAGSAPSFRAQTPGAASRPATTRPAIGELKGLIAQLDADDFAARDIAAARIALLGESARAELERQLKVAPERGEATGRIDALLAKLNEARLYAATRITLHLRNVPAHDALAALAAQANVSFAPAPDTLWPAAAAAAGTAGEPRVSVDSDDEPFWSCIHRLGAAAGFRVNRSDSHAPVQLKLADDKPASPYAVAGPFLLKIKRIEHTRSLDFDAPNDMNHTPGGRISLFVWGEPKISPGVWSIDQVEELTTDQGPQKTDRGHVYARGTQLGSINEGAITFQSDIAGSRIARLRMTLQVSLVGKTQAMEVPNVMNAGKVKRMIGGYDFELRDVNRIVEGRYAFTIEVSRGEHSSAEFTAFRQTLARAQPHLLDANGRPLQFSGGSGQSSPDKWTQTNQVLRDGVGAAKAGEPAKFSWEIPIEMRTLSFPVEFKDLPLP